MNAIRLKLIFLLVAFGSGFGSNGQDIHFSQFSEVPLLRNPALAGIFTGDVRVQSVFRNQWSSVSVPFQTALLNGEYKFPVGRNNDFMTVGGILAYDKAGSTALTTTYAKPVLNYHKSLSDERNMYLSAGFSGGLVQRSIDITKITTDGQWDGNQGDPALGNGEFLKGTNFSYFDATAGLSFNMQFSEDPDDNFYVGFAYHHLNRSANISFYDGPAVKLYSKLVFSAGLRLNVDESAFYTFYGDYSRQGPSSELSGGVMYSIKLDDNENPNYIISAGGFLRWEDAIIPMIKLESRPFSLGISYDVNVSKLKAASQARGGFELSLTFHRFLEKQANEWKCPRF